MINKKYYFLGLIPEFISVRLYGFLSRELKAEDKVLLSGLPVKYTDTIRSKQFNKLVLNVCFIFIENKIYLSVIDKTNTHNSILISTLICQT